MFYRYKYKYKIALSLLPLEPGFIGLQKKRSTEF